MSKKNKINYLPGDFIFREGEFGETAFIVEEGIVELVKFTGDKQTVLTELQSGALFGEMAIIDGSERSASARAKTECELTVVSEEQLKKHLSSSPSVALDMMRRLSSYARAANERLASDVFSDKGSEDKNETKAGKTKLQTDLDTKKTIREFNSEIDDFLNITPNRPLALSGAIIILMLLSFVIWASFTEIDVTVNARGKILTGTPNVNVESNFSSVIKTILVKEGDQVSEGKTLALFDETLLAADFLSTKNEIEAVSNDILRIQAELNFFNDVAAEPPKELVQLQVFESNIQQISALKTKLLVNKELLVFLQNKPVQDIKETQTKAYLQSKIAEIKSSLAKNKTSLAENNASLAEIDTSLKELEGKISYLEKESVRLEKLNKAKAIPSSEYEKHIHELEQLKIQREKNSIEKQQLLLQREQIKIQKEQIFANQTVDSYEKINQYSQELNQLKKEKSEQLQQLIRRNDSLVIENKKLLRKLEDVNLLAPVSGTILKIESLFSGSVVSPGDIILSIAPNDSNFHVEVDIDPSDITHVYEGARVKIMLDALPSQKHGELVGVITLISKDTVDEDIFGEKRSVYRANIKITENKLVKLPEGFSLLPSMGVSGNIISGKRKVITFLLFPVIKTLETSFREP